MHDSVRLRDGRHLVYCESGPSDGVPVVYCHGAIGTPLGRPVDLDVLTAQLGVRYVAISRPGVGGSDRSPGRRVVDFADDVAQLMDALALPKFALVGVSAGGPYALAVARKLPHRVIRVALCSSLSPFCRPHETPQLPRRIRLGLSLLARAPGTCAVAGTAVVPVIRRRPELLSRIIQAHAAEQERPRLRQPEERAAACASFLDAASGGVRGMIEDYLTYSDEWGFAVGDVQAEVHLWHGLCDLLVPLEHALQLSIAIPRCRVFLDQEEGHHFFRRRLREILGTLVTGVRSAA
jgi:pimeloyl-ACP methyl ester carboxylesterase